ncbi:hypothetical protein [Nocardia sp. alder85J]|uniref:hypothetical protein n=1 Tax=Nocardia sp. alder85J TaxID=2862949 RepID=UPI001CD38043|nr:hypothetical protein [Nocardia sp. alder85J]MCX4094188.1 hypothetical protein [Nocardia sp. alder85J]
MSAGRRSVGGESPDSRTAGVLRFTTELIGWVATPWALASVSIVLSVLSVIVLIGVPAVIGTPGDRNNSVRVPGVVTIAMMVMEFAAAAIPVWFIWWPAVAAPVVLLVVAAVIAGLPRWRWLLAYDRRNEAG